MALATRGGLPVGAEGSLGSGNTIRGGNASSLGQKALLGHGKQQETRRTSGTFTFPRRVQQHTVSATAVLDEPRSSLEKAGQQQRLINVADAFAAAPSGLHSGSLPPALYRLLDPELSVDLPPPHKVNPRSLDNRELDKLVAALGRSKATWRRSLVLHEWLLGIGHAPDDRLCTTLMRVCHQQGQAVTALSLYDWMRGREREGGAGLRPSVYTYTTAMRAALSGNLLDKALKVWDDAVASGCQPDCRMCTALIEVAARKGDTARALQMYDAMRAAVATGSLPSQGGSAGAAAASRMAPSVHAYTAAMRAAAEGGLWQRALEIWGDMDAARVTPTGHAFAAAISACAAGGAWQRAVQLFDRMLELRIRPDVVSCTALVTALGTDGQWQRAERVVEWMARSGVKPNVRTYTALVTAMGNARQWDRAVAVVGRMKGHQLGAGVEPNSYTYSALIKAMGEHGQWRLAEQVFRDLEAEALRLQAPAASASGSSSVAAPATPQQQQQRQRAVPADGADLAARLASLSVAGAPDADDGAADAAEHYGQVALDAAERVLQSMDEDDAGSAAAGPSGQQQHQQQLGNGFSLFSSAPQQLAAAQQQAAAAPAPAAAMRGPRGPVNEVVCGAMMLAYERAGHWDSAVDVLERSQRLGVAPNVVMHNTAISALGKAGKWQAAEAMFHAMLARDAVTYETLVAAYGMSGRVAQAEAAFSAMLEAGHAPRDYAYCGLVAAHSLAGDWRGALGAAGRMRAAGLPMTVHVYNALLAACERHHKLDVALELQQAMLATGVPANTATYELLAAVGRQGVAAVEGQQAAAAALSAFAAAAGTVLMRSGMF